MPSYNVSPYYDDFDAAKNYLRILFRPGRAVQARELTQAQTILQNQIASFGNNIFKDNSRILGAEIYVKSQKITLTVNPVDSNNASVDVNALLNQEIQKLNDNTTKALISHVDATNNKVLLTLHGGKFAVGDQFVTIDPVTGNPNAVKYTIDGINNSLMAYINDGIIYTGGFFATVAKQEIVVDTSDTMLNNEHVVGYIVTETTVDSVADQTLNDNAAGTMNFNAPGADRLKKTITLSSVQVVRDAGGSDVTVYPDNFQKILVVKNGVSVSDNIQKVKYAEILDLMAERTKKESGNYTISEYTYTTENDPNSQTTFNLKIGPGESVVDGYNYINQSTYTMPIPKARTTETANNQQLYFAAGIAVELSSVSVAAFDVDAEETVEIYNDTAAVGTLLGTARVLSAGLNTYGELTLYLEEGSNVVSKLASARSIKGLTSGAIGVVKLSAGAPVYQVLNKNDAIIDVISSSLYDNISNIPNTSVSYDIVKTYKAVPESAVNVHTLTAPDTTTDFYISSGVYLVVDSATGAVLTNPTDYTYSVANQNGGLSSMTITTAATHANIDVIVPMYKSVGSLRTKTLHKNVQETLTADANGVITLTNYDILQFISVEDMTDPANPVVVPSSSYTTDNGQTDWAYNVGSVSGLTAGTSYRVTYDHFSHSSTGDYFSVNSYMSAANTDPVTGYANLYSMIGNYISPSTNYTYKLINCIDTRRSPAIASSSKIRANSQNLQLDYDFYVARIDKIYISKTGVFSRIEGYPAAVPVEPAAKDGMVLMSLFVPPYTHDAKDTQVALVEHKRFTMADIAAIEKRLSNVEDYVSYNMLEKMASDLTITDANGLNRYKNGIFVDNFLTHLNGATNHPDYSVTIDAINGGIISRQIEDFNALVIDKVNSSGIVVNENTTDPAMSSDTATLAYTEVAYIEQLANTNTINVNPYAAIVWHGTMSINPATDIWVDTQYEPTINLSYGRVVRPAWTSTSTTAIHDEYTMVYNPWNDPNVDMTSLMATLNSRKDQGIPHQDTAAQRSANIDAAFNGGEQTSGWVQLIYERDRTITTTTTTTRIVPTTTYTSTDTVVGSAMLPFMRATQINYTAKGMRPNTQLVATFDGIDVSANCSNLMVDQYGNCSGTFSVPAGKFNTGTNVLILEDVDKTTDASASHVSSGRVDYHQITTTAIHSYRVITTSWTNTTTQDSYATVWADPIAQSFLVTTENDAAGVYVSSVDLYFKTKDATLPVTVHIVEMSNGMPTQKIVPDSTVTLNAADVNVSENGWTPTTFKFESPVYLLNSHEYALVITSNSNEYLIWYAKQGEPTLLNQAGQTETNRSGQAISKQPYLGVMFTSQNSSTWSEDQTADLKFSLKRCDFSSTTGTVLLDTEDLVAAGKDGMTISRFMTNISHVTPEGTNLTFEYSIDNGATWTFFNDLEKNYFNAVQTLSTAGGNKPLTIRANMTSTNTWVTPIIDLQRCGYATSINVYDATGNAGTYISKTVNLNNPAHDLRVMIDLLEPTGTAVNVFFSTQTPQVALSAANLVGPDVAAVQSTVGQDMFVYHRDATTGALTEAGSFVLAKVDSTNTYFNAISNIDIINTPASFVNVDKVFYTNISGLTSAVDWAAGTHTIGTYVFYQNNLWKALVTTTTTPAVNSTDWQLIPSMTTTSAITQGTETVWRAMKKETTLPATVDPGKKFYTYTMIPDVVIEEPFTAFSIRIELTGSDGAIACTAQNLRAIAVT